MSDEQQHFERMDREKLVKAKCLLRAHVIEAMRAGKISDEWIVRADEIVCGIAANERELYREIPY